MKIYVDKCNTAKISVLFTVCSKGSELIFQMEWNKIYYLCPLIFLYDHDKLDSWLHLIQNKHIAFKTKIILCLMVKVHVCKPCLRCRPNTVYFLLANIFFLNSEILLGCTNFTTGKTLIYKPVQVYIKHNHVYRNKLEV